MAIYEYVCEAHGAFEAVRPMADFAAPCPCPTCGAVSPRVMLTPPRLGATDRGSMRAHATNEQAADSPKRLSTHGPGCSCCAGPSKSVSKKAPDGAKSFPTKRPWMISH